MSRTGWRCWTKPLLARGDTTAAGSLIRAALDNPRRVPSKERPPYGALPRAPLLEAEVEIALAAGDATTAERASAELEEIAAAYQSRALTGAAALARGRVALARGDAQRAARACDDAVAIWSEIGAPYETSAARLVLAEALRTSGHDDRALMELRTAKATFERLGASLKARDARLAMGDEVPDDRPAESAARAVFRCDGDMRSVEFAGRSVLLKDLKGLRYLGHLLSHPGREFHVLDLVTSERGVLPRGAAAAGETLEGAHGGDIGPLLDDQAVQAYRRRLAEIDEDLDEATALGDAGHVELATTEREYLVNELVSAFGLGGRHRPTGAASERARASVTRAIRYALARICEHHDVLATHLKHTVHTGTYCTYTPDPRAAVSWTV